MAQEQVVVVHLIIKADSFEEAKNCAENALVNPLNEWFIAESHEKPPYPVGTLLHWSIHA
jgi:hypothetical protein